ncbi:alpha/beta hydrolase [Streptomyces sp. LS1784]|uniref:alpha/beta hydrolase n=1 Tax=Streptomyces sp. LS1784 TaxID=2851533 RepID=UPI001CCE6481|nr:alpha/beta hydrolase [Streptomyces sp. LS1784]
MAKEQHSTKSGDAKAGGTSRRSALKAAVAGAAAVTAMGAAAPIAHADGPRRGAPTFVLVHGSGSNSFYWQPLLRELGLRGHRAIAVDLPGHGLGAYLPESYQSPQDLERLHTEPSPISKVTLGDFAAHVIDVVRRVRRNGPVVLVGGSLGGATLNAAANQVPELVAHLVYASAFCPTEHPSVLQLMMTPEAATSSMYKIPAVQTPPELGVSRVNWRSGDPAFFAIVKEAIAADRSDAEVRALMNVLEPDESAAVGVSEDARGLPATWGRVPRTFVRYTQDRTIPLPLQDLMIREADDVTPHNRFRVRSLSAPHAGPRDPGLLAHELELVAGLCR